MVSLKAPKVGFWVTSTPLLNKVVETTASKLESIGTNEQVKEDLNLESLGVVLTTCIESAAQNEQLTARYVSNMPSYFAVIKVQCMIR